MKNYKVMLNGQNFIIDIGEGVAKHGFYTTRYTSANSKSEAETIIINDIKNSQDIKPHIRNENLDPPLLYAEDIEEVEIIDSDNNEHELSWFKEEF